MADILPSSGELPPTSEYIKVDFSFTPDLNSDESLDYIKVIDWSPNDGITVEGNRIYGEYKNTFDYGTDRLLMRKGDLFTHLDSWDDITDPEETDVYYWRAPSTPRVYYYTVEMGYSVVDTEGGGGLGGGGTITKTFTHSILPNYDTYAEKLREQIRIRRLAWRD